MSVVLFTKEEILDIRRMLGYHLEEAVTIVKYSEAYKDAFCLQARFNQELPAEDELADCVLDSLIYYAWVANKVAYAVQYGETVDLAEALQLGNAIFTECSFEQLQKRLGNLQYNLYTNGGAIFLEHKWFQLLEKLARISKLGE